MYQENVFRYKLIIIKNVNSLTLEVVEKEKELGFIINDKLEFDKHT